MKLDETGKKKKYIYMQNVVKSRSKAREKIQF